uniref:(northern house mosquito) hypothetical protein n=1 Tax=Culex pipiens TaxID=7175 RepID=A0A8D8L021_CULPI
MSLSNSPEMNVCDFSISVTVFLMPFTSDISSFIRFSSSASTAELRGTLSCAARQPSEQKYGFDRNFGIAFSKTFLHLKCSHLWQWQHPIPFFGSQFFFSQLAQIISSSSDIANRSKTPSSTNNSKSAE